MLDDSSVKATFITIIVQALSAPWFLKPLWAPLVDSYPSKQKFDWMRRKFIWIVPQAGLLAIMLFISAGITSSSSVLAMSQITGLIIVIAIQNFLAASIDISVDGLAVNSLESYELGWGNSVQVVAYKIGILIGGSLLAYLLTPNWDSIAIVLAFLVCISVGLGIGLGEFVLKPRMPEPAKSVTLLSMKAGMSNVSAKSENELVVNEEELTWRQVFVILKENVWHMSHLWIFLCILFYKSGEVIGDRLFKLFLRSYGYSIQDISLYVGISGEVSSIIGSITGGFIAKKFYSPFALTCLGILTTITLIFRYMLAAISAWRNSILAIVIVEVFVSVISGMLTTVMFTFMMSLVDKRIASSHFTLYAVLEVIGKGIPGLLAGFFSDRHGFIAIFIVSFILESIFVVFAIMLLITNTNIRKMKWKNFFHAMTNDELKKEKDKTRLTTATLPY
jgi:MFS family permease